MCMYIYIYIYTHMCRGTLGPDLGAQTNAPRVGCVGPWSEKNNLR